METLAALAAQVQNLATRLHELEEHVDRVSGHLSYVSAAASPSYGPPKPCLDKNDSAELSRLAAQMRDLERGMVP